MANRSNKTRTVEVLPSVTPEQGLILIGKLIEKGKHLLGSPPINADDYEAWCTVARDYLAKTFGSLSPNLSAVMDIGRYGAFPMNASEAFWERQRAANLQKQLTVLQGLSEVLDTEISLDSPPGAGTGVKVPEPAQRTNSNQAFLVHGHDTAILEGTARFLEKLGISPLILHEQPDQGRTIIEKFVDHSDVPFAVVLLTADDRGGSIASNVDDYRPRARQNVLLELGYFIGRLGRNRVCALYREGVEIPSDYSGVLFVPLDDAGAWKFRLAREMKAAGFAIDMNRAL